MKCRHHSWTSSSSTSSNKVGEKGCTENIIILTYLLNNYSNNNHRTITFFSFFLLLWHYYTNIYGVWILRRDFIILAPLALLYKHIRRVNSGKRFWTINLACLAAAKPMIFSIKKKALPRIHMHFWSNHCSIWYPMWILGSGVFTCSFRVEKTMVWGHPKKSPKLQNIKDSIHIFNIL